MNSTPLTKNIIRFDRPDQPHSGTFRSGEGITDELLKAIQEKGIQYGLKTILPFDVKDIVVANWVNLKCRYGCSQFKSNWSCPPATPDVNEVKAILSEYSKALLLIGHHTCSDFYKGTNKQRTGQVRYWLVSGACSLCKTCAYPAKCRFPMEKRPTVESFAIDLIGTLKTIGITTDIATDLKETFKYYSMILLD